MKPDKVLEIMRAGGKVEERWKKRSSDIQRPHRQVILTDSNGNRRIIQRSCVEPLIKRGLVWRTAQSGGEYVYRLVGETD